MTIRFLCPTGHSLSVPDDWAGRRIRCAACKETVFVPGAPKAGPSQREERASKRPVPPPLPPGRGPIGPPAAEPPPAQTKCSPVRRLLVPERPGRMPADVYRVDRGRLATLRWLALILALVVAFSVAPVFYDYASRLNPATAPDWARVAVLLAVVQAGYIAWMLNVPDWASVWVVMLVFAAVAAIYAVGTAVALATPLEDPIWLEMGEVRTSARAWCGSVLLAMALATYLCGRTATKWRRSFELETAGRSRPRGKSETMSTEKTV